MSRTRSVESLSSNGSFYIPTIFELINGYKASDPSPSRLPINIYLNDAECSICLAIMLKPFSLGCGHTLCARCIRETFDFALKSNLKRFIHAQSHDGHSLATCQRVPTKKEDRVRLCRAIKSHGEAPEDVLAFECPICWAPVVRSPSPNYLLTTHFNELRDILADHLDSSKFDIELEAPSYLFNGLFQ
ncbi:hypothetical protein DFP72DRAFT_851828 [Ephemerocybe angulata]|uniref:RING-type domain-containing protein n=1 Tax=Ephemerocybe angulata TaxID=980116 RepID=A0A8H6HQU8_9AGAR|nr:hypothetical protein DFP72DRAFT_851828 [Tulosesus angulatus]